MLRFIKNGLLFLLLSLICYVGTLWILNSLIYKDTPVIYRINDGYILKGGNAFRTFEDYDHSGHQNIVVLGSSHAYRGYDSRLFKSNDIDLFNLGTYSQSLSDSKTLAKEVLKKDEVDLLVIDLYSAIFATDGIESGSYLISNVSSDIAAAKIALNMGDIRAVNMMTLRLLNKNSAPKIEADSYTYKGYSSKTDSVKNEIRYEKYGNKFICTDKQKKGLIDLLAYCKEQGLKVVLVSHPQPSDIKHDAHDDFILFLNEILADYPYPFLDYTYGHELHSQHHFYDNTHLNQAGVNLFNQELINDLRPYLAK